MQTYLLATGRLSICGVCSRLSSRGCRKSEMTTDTGDGACILGKSVRWHTSTMWQANFRARRIYAGLYQYHRKRKRAVCVVPTSIPSKSTCASWSPSLSASRVSVSETWDTYMFHRHHHRLKGQRVTINVTHHVSSSSSIRIAVAPASVSPLVSAISRICFHIRLCSAIGLSAPLRETGSSRLMAWPWRRLMHLMCIAWFVDIAYGQVWWFVDIACGHRHRIWRIGLPVHYVMYWLLALAYLKGYDNEHEDENTRATDALGV